MIATETQQQCPLCNRVVPIEKMSDHHIVPRSRGGREKELICHACHKKIHATFSNKELEHDFNSVEKLASHPSMLSFIKWISKQPPEYVPKSKESRERRRKR